MIQQVLNLVLPQLLLVAQYLSHYQIWLVGSGLTALLAQKGYIVPRIIQN